jgi:predicted nuclease of predicted toxin-antitoxin system
MIHVLLDQGLAPSAAQTLRKTGWIASHVSELGMDRADDSTILEYARQRGMACVTLGHDFHAHLAMASSGSPSVVLIRIEGLSGARQAELIQRVWKYCGMRFWTARRSPRMAL